MSWKKRYVRTWGLLGMNCEWKNYKIGEVVDIRRGSSPRPIHKYLKEDGMPWVKIADATASTSRYIEKTNEFISFEGVPYSLIVEPETLIVSNSATPGLPKIMKIKACVHDGWLVFFNYQNVIRDFLYYKFIEIQRKLINQANGSVFQNLKTDIVKNFEIKIPNILTQQKIVTILSSLDDKIELNNRINRNLEEQAQALFKSWFVDFEPFGGVMPSDWGKGCLLDIAEYINGLAMQKFRPSEGEKGLPVLKIKELRQGICDDNSELCSPSINDEYIVHDGDVIFSWSGSLLVDLWCGGTCGLNQHLFKVTSNKYNKWFFYLWTKYYLDRFIAIAADKATTMGHIKREDLQKAEVIIPSISDMKKLDDVLNSIIELIIVKRIENRKLANIRDTLLPKLMSGEIDVDKVEI